MNYRSTKFWQTNFVLVTSLVLACMGVLDGTAYTTITGIALANYAYADVKQKGIK